MLYIEPKQIIVFKDKALQDGSHPKIRTDMVGNYNDLLILNGNTSRCHKKHIELGTDK